MKPVRRGAAGVARWRPRLVAGLVLLVLGACRETEWVDVDTTGCDRLVVAQLDQPGSRHDAEVARATAAGMCAAQGRAASTGVFRCVGHVMQVQCRR